MNPNTGEIHMDVSDEEQRMNAWTNVRRIESSDRNVLKYTAIALITAHLGLEPRVTVRGDEVKCYVPCRDLVPLDPEIARQVLPSDPRDGEP